MRLHEEQHFFISILIVKLLSLTGTLSPASCQHYLCLLGATANALRNQLQLWLSIGGATLRHQQDPYDKSGQSVFFSPSFQFSLKCSRLYANPALAATEQAVDAKFETCLKGDITETNKALKRKKLQ